MSSFFYTVPEEIQEQRDVYALIRLCEGGDEALDASSSEKMISSLLEKKPSFVSMEMHGVTPLLAATSANNLKLIDVLCQFAEHHGEGGEGFVEYESIANDQTALIAASAMGYEKAVKKLCEEYKADANRITKIGGRTAMMAACENDKPEIVVLLKEKFGADVNLEVRKSSRVRDDDDEEEEERTFLLERNVTCVRE
jgi:ankyrin repeat protein